MFEETSVNNESAPSKMSYKIIQNLELPMQNSYSCDHRNVVVRDRSLFIPGVGTEEIWVG